MSHLFNALCDMGLSRRASRILLPRARCRSGAAMKTILKVGLAALICPMGLAGQRLEISPRVGLGLEASKLHATQPTVEAAARLEIWKGNWGAYGRLGILAISSGC